MTCESTTGEKRRAYRDLLAQIRSVEIQASVFVWMTFGASMPCRIMFMIAIT